MIQDFAVPTGPDSPRTPNGLRFVSRRIGIEPLLKSVFQSVDRCQDRGAAKSGFGGWRFFFEVSGLKADELQHLTRLKRES